MSDVEDLDFKEREKQMLIESLIKGNLNGIKYFVEDYCVLKDNLINLNKKLEEIKKDIDRVEDNVNSVEKYIDINFEKI